jgi:hypothetical protein
MYLSERVRVKVRVCAREEELCPDAYQRISVRFDSLYSCNDARVSVSLLRPDLPKVHVRPHCVRRTRKRVVILVQECTSVVRRRVEQSASQHVVAWSNRCMITHKRVKVSCLHAVFPAPNNVIDPLARENKRQPRVLAPEAVRSHGHAGCPCCHPPCPPIARHGSRVVPVKHRAKPHTQNHCLGLVVEALPQGRLGVVLVCVRADPRVGVTRGSQRTMNLIPKVRVPAQRDATKQAKCCSLSSTRCARAISRCLLSVHKHDWGARCYRTDSSTQDVAC